MIRFISHLKRLAPLLPALALFLALPARAQSSDSQSFTNETPAEHDARMKWFRDARFGMFIHWGLYAEAAGSWNGKPTSGAGEWIMNDMQIPDSQYAKMVPQFNPTKFDARQWVAIAKNAGMKYIVITSKHHEGFDMYNSALGDWGIKSTPFGRDPLKELSVACREAGIKLCFYHSIMDWHHPDYLPKKPWNDLANPNPDFDRYVAYMKGQLKELLTGYGPIGILWFDGEWENTWTYDRGVDLYNYIRSLQPNIIVNNRVGREVPAGKAKIGDYGTPEQTIPPNGYGPGVDWETCMTMNDTWGFKRQDTNWKSPEMLIRNLVDIASKGGNYLLNVGPTAEGLIPDASIERLATMGQWMKVNGEAIYDTSASPFNRQLPWGRCTQKVAGRGRQAVTLYFHVFDWPTDGKLTVPGLKTAPRRVWLLSDPKRNALSSQVTDDGLVITVPAGAPDPISSTIAARFSTPLDISPIYLGQEKDGSVKLPARDAQLNGNAIGYEKSDDRDNIGFWSDPADFAEWKFSLRTPARFDVSAEIAATASGTFDVTVADRTLHCTSPNTGDWAKFQTVDLGEINIPSPGVATLEVHPVKTDWHPMNLRAVILKPIVGAP